MVDRESRLVRVLRAMLGIGMIVQGINHFVFTDLMIRIMPRYLGWHQGLVLVSGAIEIVLGALVLVPRTRRLAGWCLLALLVVVFPANIEMVWRAYDFPEFPAVVLWARLPLQLVLGYWVWMSCLQRPPPRQTSEAAT